MSVGFPRISWWLWGASKDGEPSNSDVSPLPLSSSFNLGLDFREPKTNSRGSSTRRPGRRKRHSREDRRIDREYDIVMVPQDGVCLSGSESEDSDWSIGWLETHAPEFQSDDEGESSFAVLVPCYGRGRAGRGGEGVKNRILGAFDLTDSSDSKKYMEELLSTLQNS